MRRWSKLYAVCLAALASVGSVPAVSLGGDGPPAQQDEIVVEALLRLPGVSWQENKKLAAAVQRYLEGDVPEAQLLKIAKQLNPPDVYQRLLSFIVAKGPDSNSLQAVEILLDHDQGEKLLKAIVEPSQIESGRVIAKVLGLSNRPAAASVLTSVISNPELDLGLRSDAALALSRSDVGQRAILALIKEGKFFPAEYRLLVAGPMRSSNNAETRKAAEELFPVAVGKEQNPLPPVDQLAMRKGDPGKGHELFKTVATCANCHVVAGQGKNVGPDLSEIGSKLSREAMFVSILDPSAGISHNYETFAVQTESGEVVTGLLVSQTDAEIILKDAMGIERTFPKSEVEEFKKQEKSIMPENLHHNFNEQGLVDIIEYLGTLKKK